MTTAARPSQRLFQSRHEGGLDTVTYPSWSHAVTLPPAEESPSRSRSFVRTHLLRHDLATMSDDVELVASELTTNAVRHAGTAFTLTLERDGPSVRLSVRDRGVGAVVEAHAPDWRATNGRGLLIVSSISAEWGVHRDSASTVTWACFEIGDPGR